MNTYLGPCLTLGPDDVDPADDFLIGLRESLFLAGIHPRRAAGRVARHRYELLADAIKKVLQKAIKAGGTTLRDFYGGNGEAGYFRHELTVYDRQDEPCIRCNGPITAIVLGQRSTYYCKHCQK